MDGLDVTYRGARPVTALSDVSVTIGEGEALSLVGESGSGKSTFARAIGGLLSGTADVTYRELKVVGVGLDSSGQHPGLGSDIAYVFQEPQSHLNPSIRIGTQLAEVLRIQRGMSRKAAKVEAGDLLEEVGIRDGRSRLRDYPHQFSGGQAQRVAIAIALAAEPKLLVADEPTSALDVTVAARIVALLRRIQLDRGMSMIHVTHNLHLAARTADRVAVMYAGQVVETGPARDVLADPKMPYTQGLLEAAPVAQSKTGLKPIPGSLPDTPALISGCRFAGRCEHARSVCEEPVALHKVNNDRFARCVRWTEIDRQRRAALVVADARPKE